jgi:glutathione S-transferase
LPQDAHGRARAIGWMFSALSSVEPLIVEREMTGFVERDRDWYQDRLPIMEERIHRRLGDLAQRLGDAEWLDGDFSAGDLMMVTVLRRAVGSGLLATHPNLSAYVARGQARPAFQRAFADQLALFRASGQDQAV